MMSTFRAAWWARPIAADKRAAFAARPVVSPEVPRPPVVVRVDAWRCQCLARRQTPLGSYCARHAAALAAHFGWAAADLREVRAA